jgi:hypothetical protein
MNQEPGQNAPARVGDKEAVFDAKIAPLLRQAMEICRDSGIPFIACTQFADESFATSASLPEYSDPRLHAGMALFRNGVLAFMVQMMSPGDPVAGGSGGVSH